MCEMDEIQSDDDVHEILQIDEWMEFYRMSLKKKNLLEDIISDSKRE